MSEPDTVRDSLLAALGRGERAVVAPDDYDRLLAAFPVLAREDTCFAGDILVLDTPAGPSVAEQDPDSRRGIFRAFATEEAARAFVADRLETYDRMWDGCGCKVDYFRD